MRRGLILLACLSQWGAAQQYAFVPMRLPNAPVNINVLFQDHVGRLWVGTSENAGYFDGTRFLYLTDFGFPRTEVQGISEDDEGGIWLASKLGLFRFSKGLLHQLQKGDINDVIRVSPGVMLATADTPTPDASYVRRIYRFKRENQTWITAALPALVVSGHISANHNGTITFAGEGSGKRHPWYEIAPEALANWKAEVPLVRIEHASPPGVSIREVFRDQSGCIWFRNEAMTHYQCATDKKATPLPLAVTTGDRRMVEMRDGRLLLPGAQILALGRPGKFEVARIGNGLPIVNAVLEAADGTIWIAGSKGLFKFSYPFHLEFWTERDGLTVVNTTLRVGDRILAGDGDGIKQLSADRRVWSPLPKLPSYQSINDMLPGPQGTLYIVPYYRGFAHVAMDGSLIHAPPDGLQPGMKLAQTRDGKLWVAGLGVSRVDFAGAKTRLIEEPLPANHFDGLDIKTNRVTGDLWACYAGGLITRTTSLMWQHFTDKDGLLQNTCRSFALGANGDIWYGYKTLQAFSLLRGFGSQTPHVVHFRSGENIGDAAVHFLDFDHRQWLWRGGGDGVYVSNSAAAERGEWVHLSEIDGLQSLDTNQGFYEEPDGSVWIGAETTLTHFKPPDNLLESKPAEAFLSALSWDSNPPRMAEAITAIPRGVALTAHIGSLQFERRNALKVRYRMLPGHTLWTESHNFDIPLGTPISGNHTLELQARLGLSGTWSHTSAYSLTVLPPFWLSSRGLSAIAVATLGCASILLPLYKRRRRRERKALPDLTSLRMEALLPEAQALLGTKLDGRFAPIRIMAEGGFATVFEGHDHRYDRRCAIKVFHRKVADEGLNKRFQQEVSALETIVHPNVVRLYGHGAAPSGVPYLVMEFVEGTTLRDALPSEGFSPRKVASLLRQISNALGAIHTLGIYHRDLKPENLMIRSVSKPDEDLVLIDFSIAIVQSPDESMHGISRAAGTFQYMAPEQAVGFVDSASDVYSLAKVVIELLTGTRLSALLPKAARDLPDRVREVLTTLPVQLSSTSIDLIIAALRFDPDGRPSSAVAFGEQIAADLESSQS